MSVPPRRHFVFEIISTTHRQTDTHTHRVTYGGGAHLKIVYAENTQQFNEYVEAMKKNHTYKKYANFKNHMEEKILPRFSEWSVKERLEKKLPTHNQNTTNYVEYSFRMTKDVQFSRLKAYNLTDLLSICLDDSKLYTRRCIDVSHNRNYHLFTNQKSKYLYKKKTLTQMR